MFEHTLISNRNDLLDLTRLAALLDLDETAAGRHLQSPKDTEVVDRLYRLLEIGTLIEEHGSGLHSELQFVSPEVTQRFAADLRRIANRLQAFSDFLAGTAESVLEIEDALMNRLEHPQLNVSQRDYAA